LLVAAHLGVEGEATRTGDEEGHETDEINHRQFSVALTRKFSAVGHEEADTHDHPQPHGAESGEQSESNHQRPHALPAGGQYVTRTTADAQWVRERVEHGVGPGELSPAV